jgi:hypothetical protein
MDGNEMNEVKIFCCSGCSYHDFEDDDAGSCGYICESVPKSDGSGGCSNFNPVRSRSSPDSSPKIDFGMHKGHSLDWICEFHPSYGAWMMSAFDDGKHFGLLEEMRNCEHFYKVQAKRVGPRILS